MPEKSHTNRKSWGLYISLCILVIGVVALTSYGYWRITSMNRLLSQQVADNLSRADEYQHMINTLQAKLSTVESNMAQLKKGSPENAPIISTPVVHQSTYPSFSATISSLSHASGWDERKKIARDNLQQLITLHKDPVWSIETPIWFATLCLFVILFLLYGIQEIGRLFSTICHRIKAWSTHIVTHEQRIAVYQNLLNAAENTASLKLQWNGVPWKLKKEPQVLLCYINNLQRYHADAEDIQSLLTHHLKKSWDADLMMSYGLLITRDSVKQLARAESWMDAYSDQAIFLLSLGRLSVRCQLWGKARQYFESSLKKEERSDTYWEYGKLLEQIGDPTLAMPCYREGLRLVNQPVA